MVSREGPGLKAITGSSISKFCICNCILGISAITGSSISKFCICICILGWYSMLSGSPNREASVVSREGPGLKANTGSSISQFSLETVGTNSLSMNEPVCVASVLIVHWGRADLALVAVASSPSYRLRCCTFIILPEEEFLLDCFSRLAGPD